MRFFCVYDKNNVFRKSRNYLNKFKQKKIVNENNIGAPKIYSISYVFSIASHVVIDPPILR